MKNIVLPILLLFAGAASAQQVPDGPFLDVLLSANTTTNIIAWDNGGDPMVIDANGDYEVTAEEAEEVFTLDISGNALGIPDGIEYFTDLERLYCNDCGLTALEISALEDLEELRCNNNLLTALDLSALDKLIHVECLENDLITLDLSNKEYLEYVDCSRNQTLAALVLTGSVHIKELYCWQNELTSIDCSELSEVEILNCSNNNLVTLDLNNCISLTELHCNANYIETLFIKNGSEEQIIGDPFWFENEPMVYICADDFQITALETLAPDTIQINSYCTYEPGGLYTTITGHVVYDADSNSCDALDFTAPSVKLLISAGAYEDTVFSGADGTYSFFVNEPGDYTITPVFENDYFISEPVVVSIVVADGATIEQDVCVVPDGSHSDVEVVIAPVTPAQPGFEAVYKIVYKNKGTQFEAGEVTCQWNDDVLQYISAEPAIDAVAPNLYTWYYDNLQPFESREIYMTLEVNAPTDTPPVNLGDVLLFTMGVTADEDELPEDNIFSFEQEVTGSYDPNNIVCIEGDLEAPDTIGDYLHYIVNFENTGTAPANFVVVTYELNTADYQLDTMQLIDSSNAVDVRAQGNSFEFRFDNIMLGVADHGNILFKVKSKGSLMAGDEVGSQVNIYFDYNFPVITNEAVTAFDILGTEEFETDTTIMVYPNPAKDVVNISGDYGLTSVQLYDIQGRLLQTSLVNDTQMTLNLAGRASGMYFVKVTSEKGVAVEKIIKE